MFPSTTKKELFFGETPQVSKITIKGYNLQGKQFGKIEQNLRVVPPILSQVVLDVSRVLLGSICLLKGSIARN